jgi:type VI secretion system protein ImpG
MSDKLFALYNSELNWIRKAASEFAQANPAVARNLNIDASDVRDPHVERIIEAFAFLTARVRRKIDDEFPEITASMLELLYPHYLRPIPSMAIVQFEVPRKNADVVDGWTIPSGTMLESETLVDKHKIRFRTGWDTTAYPIEIVEASVGAIRTALPQRVGRADAELRISLATYVPDIPLSALSLEALRVHLGGADPTVARLLYERMLNDVVAVGVQREPGSPVILLPDDAVKPVGLEAEHCLLPCPPVSFVGYRLLTEYFAFPAKFLFVEIGSLRQALKELGSTQATIVFYLKTAPGSLERVVHKSNFELGCTPVVNLFSHAAEPIDVDGELYEYRVAANRRAESAYEVYSIDSVRAVFNDKSERAFVPFYSLRRRDEQDQPVGFYHATRRPSSASSAEVEGSTDVFLSHVDLGRPETRFESGRLYVQTTCLNRDLPERLAFGPGEPRLRAIDAPPVAVRCLTKPTRTRRLNLYELNQWRLVAHLSLNHMTFVGGADAAEAMKQALRLYDFVASESTNSAIDGLLSIDGRTTLARTMNGPAGLCRGLEITASFDEGRYADGGLFLFASVLERFVSLASNINSFTRFVAVGNDRREVRRWKPRAGAQLLV